jgi:hypothetical protein
MLQLIYHIHKEITSKNELLAGSTILCFIGLALYTLFPLLVARFLYTSISTLSLKP